MGSPTGPVLANAFLCHHEQLWLDNCPPEFKPKFYRRYVDDTFVLFDNQEQSDLFLAYLNTKHTNIKFTREVEVDAKISFLDVLIQRENGVFVTSLFRKATFTGLGTNFFSSCQSLFKVNAIKTLIYRAYHISSSYKCFHSEIEFLINYFCDNCFPKKLVLQEIRKFVNAIYSTKPQLITVPKLKKYVTLPYLGYLSIKVKEELTSLFSKFFPHLNIIIIFTNNNSIASFFNAKERLEPLMCSGVVYKYTCSSCNACYIGSTTRRLIVRISEHKGVSSRTGQLTLTQTFSAIREHCLEKDHVLKTENFSIIDRAYSHHDLLIKESLHINAEKPNLNNQMSAYKLYMT